MMALYLIVLCMINCFVLSTEEHNQDRTSQLGKTHSFELRAQERNHTASYVPSDLNTQRRERIKAAMLHAWSSYERLAWGADELQPLTEDGVNSFGGLGLTIIESLDTLHIMGFKDQFQKARDFVATLDFNKNFDASVFETTIRVVGGLISAYDLSNDSIFLKKAREIADRLLPAWNTETGIPYPRVNLATGKSHGGVSVLAEVGTEQVEFIALSQRTGDTKYMTKVENVIKKMKSILPKDGLFPIYINSHNMATFGKKTFGGQGDSFYEYLLKTWVLGGKTSHVQGYRDMWELSMSGLMKLLEKSTPSEFLYVSESENGKLNGKMEELACFIPAMLVLGSDDAPAAEKAKYMKVAEQLARTCYMFHSSSPIGLAADTYESKPGQNMIITDPKSILRPETIESLFYLWRKTGDKMYQEWGWNIFLAFEKHSLAASGYTGFTDVRSGQRDNKMQSFFLAEVLKYLYLLFSPQEVLSFNEWVFNTEAHPIKIVPRKT